MRAPGRKMCKPPAKAKRRKKRLSLEFMWSLYQEHRAKAKEWHARVVKAAGDGKDHRFSIRVWGGAAERADFQFSGTLREAVKAALKKLEKILPVQDRAHPNQGTISITLLPAKGQKIRLPSEMYKKYLPKPQIDPADVVD